MSATGMSKKSTQAPSATAIDNSTICCGIIAGVILGTIGVVLLPVGVQKLNRDTALSAERNFEEMDAPCRIVGVHHHVDKREQALETKSGDSGDRVDQWVCWDIYVYMFSSEGSVYQSREEVFRRGATTKNDCARAGAPKPGSFSKDEEVTCWKPTTSSVPDEYRCGNSACLKIFDPESEVTVKEGGARMMVLGGGALLGIGIAMCAAFGTLSIWSSAQSLEQNQKSVEQKSLQLKKDVRFQKKCELRNLAVTIGDHPKNLPELPAELP